MTFICLRELNTLTGDDPYVYINVSHILYIMKNDFGDGTIVSIANGVNFKVVETPQQIFELLNRGVINGL